MLTVSIVADEVLPDAEAIDLSVGEELFIDVESDRAGELHVRSKLQQFIQFGAGTAHTKFAIDTPGSVEIEDHDTGAVVALMQVR